MKLSDKIAKEQGKGGPWYSHARQLEAEVEHLGDKLSEQGAELRNAVEKCWQLEQDLKHARRTLPDIRPPLDLIDPQVVAIMAAIMRQSGVHRIEFDPRRVLREQGSDQIEVSRNVVDDCMTLTLVNTDREREDPALATDIVTRYQQLVVRAFDELGGDILDDDDPAQAFVERLEALLFRHLIPAWLSARGKGKGFMTAGGRAFIVQGEPQPAILVGGEPDVPCVPERSGRHEWYTDGQGGMLCRRCGLRTVQGGFTVKGGDHA